MDSNPNLSKVELAHLIRNALPYPDQIQRIDLHAGHDSVQVEWRHTLYQVDKNLRVDKVISCFLRGDNETLLMEVVLENAYTHKQKEEKQ